MATRLLIFVLCVSAVSPPGMCTCSATPEECRESHRAEGVVTPPVDEDACCHCSRHRPAEESRGPTAPVHEHKRHHDHCQFVSADQTNLIAPEDAGPTDAITAVFGLAVLDSAVAPLIPVQPANPASHVPPHISTVVLRT